MELISSPFRIIALAALPFFWILMQGCGPSLEVTAVEARAAKKMELDCAQKFLLHYLDNNEAIVVYATPDRKGHRLQTSKYKTDLTIEWSTPFNVDDYWENQIVGATSDTTNVYLILAQEKEDTMYTFSVMFDRTSGKEISRDTIIRYSMEDPRLPEGPPSITFSPDFSHILFSWYEYADIDDSEDVLEAITAHFMVFDRSLQVIGGNTIQAGLNFWYFSPKSTSNEPSNINVNRRGDIYLSKRTRSISSADKQNEISQPSIANNGNVYITDFTPENGFSLMIWNSHTNQETTIEHSLSGISILGDDLSPAETILKPTDDGKILIATTFLRDPFLIPDELHSVIVTKFDPALSDPIFSKTFHFTEELAERLIDEDEFSRFYPRDLYYSTESKRMLLIFEQQNVTVRRISGNPGGSGIGIGSSPSFPKPMGTNTSFFNGTGHVLALGFSKDGGCDWQSVIKNNKPLGAPRPFRSYLWEHKDDTVRYVYSYDSGSPFETDEAGLYQGAITMRTGEMETERFLVNTGLRIGSTEFRWLEHFILLGMGEGHRVDCLVKVTL